MSPPAIRPKGAPATIRSKGPISIRPKGPQSGKTVTVQIVTDGDTVTVVTGGGEDAGDSDG